MTYSETIPYIQRAFAMMKKETLSRVGSGQAPPDEFINVAMAEDVISRALLRAIKDEQADATTEIDKQRYKRLKDFFFKQGG